MKFFSWFKNKTKKPLKPLPPPLPMIQVLMNKNLGTYIKKIGLDKKLKGVEAHLFVSGEPDKNPLGLHRNLRVAMRLTVPIELATATEIIDQGYDGKRFVSAFDQMEILAQRALLRLRRKFK